MYRTGTRRVRWVQYSQRVQRFPRTTVSSVSVRLRIGARAEPQTGQRRSGRGSSRSVYRTAILNPGTPMRSFRRRGPPIVASGSSRRIWLRSALRNATWDGKCALLPRTTRRAIRWTSSGAGRRYLTGRSGLPGRSSVTAFSDVDLLLVESSGEIDLEPSDIERRGGRLLEVAQEGGRRGQANGPQLEAR